LPKLVDYRCVKCMKQFEVEMPVEYNGKELKCPHCKKPMKKVWSPVAGFVRT
jgi:putative FmdB family regulatory protein